MEPEITIVIILMIVSAVALIIRCTHPKSGIIPAIVAMVSGGGVTVLSTRILELMDPYTILFLAALGFVLMSLSGFMLLSEGLK